MALLSVYREPRLLICDEATSALDTGTERGIMDALSVLASGRTSIFVAHRLVRISTLNYWIEQADDAMTSVGLYCNT